MEEVKILKLVLSNKKYKVYTNIETVILTEDIIVNNKVLKDSTFSLDKWNEIKNSNNESLLYEKTLKFIDYKPRTKKEIENYLTKNLIDISIINRIINKLMKIKYIDDDRYSKNFILESMKKCIGPIIIKNKLDALGIDKDVYSEYLSEYDLEKEYSNAEIIVNNYLKQISKYPVLKQKQLIYNKLLRCGYSYDICNKIIYNLKLND